ncbi:hypothetical protein DPMN_044861 [Dreissena polymorpha]|uniref:Uncharacterized protein n=1 Tax=Dreissena polymorpha TaxID=45954 RepID=A0A9D4D5D7_DREPO|nr:hypothetical protein DPMN_044861 [Dreissena polymorpha]
MSGTTVNPNTLPTDFLDEHEDTGWRSDQICHSGEQHVHTSADITMNDRKLYEIAILQNVSSE